MQLTYRGSVNRWECDENDHLNVRFCEQKLYQTLLSGLLEHHCLAGADIDQLPAMILRQHIRFQAESRIAAPLGGYFSAVASDEFQVLVELRNEATGAVACSMLCDFGNQAIGARLGQLDNGIAPEAIPYAWPRGITANVALHHLTLDQASDLGFRTIGAGVLERAECTDAGLLLPYQCMGRISDSMPHLWGTVFPESHANEEEGGAVLEFRRAYDGTLRSGDPFRVMSGIVEVGPKVQSFAHLIFNPQTQRCHVCAQAMALRMDLQARKSIIMDEDALAKLRAQQIKLP
jgi:acyl-CoA thioester hydrolase